MAEINKFVIRQALRERLDQGAVANLATLIDDVERELGNEGFAIDGGVHEKIDALARESWTRRPTGVQQALRTRIKSRRAWLLLSLAATLTLSIVGSVVGAVIEFYVQKPLEAGAFNGSVTATLTLPSVAQQQHLDFDLMLTSQADQALSDLVVFASAGSSVTQLKIPTIQPSSSVESHARLKLAAADSAPSFMAYIIGPGLSFKTDAVTIRRQGPPGQVILRSQIALTQAPAARPVARAQQIEKAEATQAQEIGPTGMDAPSTATMAKRKTPLLGARSAKKDRSVETKSKSVGRMLAAAAQPSPVSTLRIAAFDIDSEVVQLTRHIQDPKASDSQRQTARQLLRTFANTGNQRALDALAAWGD